MNFAKTALIAWSILLLALPLEATLAPPTSLSARIPTPTSIQLIWDDTIGESGYLIERKLTTESDWISVGTTAAGITTFQDQSVESDAQYDYRVTSTKDMLRSNPSGIISGITLCRPRKPTALQAQALNPNKVHLHWEDADLETQYRIERRINYPTRNSDWIPTLISANSTSFIHSSLLSNEQHEFRIQGINALGASAWVTARVRTDPTPPRVPTLSVLSTPPYRVSLWWWRSDNADYFVLERREEGTPWNEIATLTGRSYSDTSVKPTTRYDYRIRAFNGAGASPWSPAIAAETEALHRPFHPVRIGALPIDDTTIRVTWATKTPAEEFTVRQRAGVGMDGEWVDVWTGTTKEHLVENLEPGQRYCFQIVASNAAGPSLPSDIVCASPTTLVPLAETDFSDEQYKEVLTISGGIPITNGGSGFPDGTVMWFGASGSRSLELPALDLRNGGYLEITSRTGDEPPGSDYWGITQVSFSLRVEYSLDGQQWRPLQILRYPHITAEWGMDLIEIPLAARSEATRLRIRQSLEVDEADETWAVDRLRVLGPNSTLPSLAIASTNSPHAVYLHWRGIEGATSYLVERANSTNGWQRLDEVEQTYFLDSNLLAGSTYTYRVTARGARTVQSLPAQFTTRTFLDQWLADRFPALAPGDRRAQLVQPTAPGTLSLLEQYAYDEPARRSHDHCEPPLQSGHPSIYLDHSSGRLRAQFRRRKPELSPELSYVFELSSNGRNWTAVSEPLVRRSINEQWEEVVLEDLHSVGQESTRLGRVRVTFKP